MQTDTKKQRRKLIQVPPEGVGGYSQTWWPVCLSSEVAVSSIKGVDFLGGRVIVFRDAQQVAHVLSAYCMHLGADLCNGDVHENSVRCPFHHWRFNSEGSCVATGIGDPAPPGARLFRFPVVERHGVIWAFNGEEPAWGFPNFFPFADEELTCLASYDLNGDFPCDAWVAMANTPDWNHLKVVHRLEFEHTGLNDSMEFGKNSFHYRIEGRLEHGTGSALSYDRWVWGTNIFVMYGTLDEAWFGVSNALMQVKPGVSRNFYIIVVQKSGPSAQAVKADLERCREILKVGTDMVNEDWPILSGLRFSPSHVTNADQGLIRFLRYVRDYPRSDVAEDFIT